MKQLVTIMAALALSFNAVAADKKAKAVPAVTYKLDTEASKALWTGKKVAGSHNGAVKFKEGNFEMKSGSMTGSVVVDLDTITCTDLTDAEYNKKLVGHLKSEDFFNVAKYPTATFKIKSSTEMHPITAGQPNLVLKGDLTVRGITKPSEVSVVFTPSETGFEAKGKLLIDRTQFGLKYNSKKFFDAKALGDKIINDEFEIDFTLVAKK